MFKASRHYVLLGSAVALLALAGVSPGMRSASAGIAKPFWTEGDPGDASGRPDSFADLADKVSPAVVNIKVERKTSMKGGPEELFEEFFGQRKPGEKGEKGEKHAPPHQMRVPSTGS